MFVPSRYTLSVAAILAMLATLAPSAAAQQPGPAPAAATAATSPPEAAQPPEAARSPATATHGAWATAAQIQRINESMTLMQAQLNELELRAKIAAKQKEIRDAGGDSPLSSFDSKSGTPTVVAVAGLKGHLEATLVFPGGATQRVKQGDVIEERRVARVALNEVVLTDLRGKNSQRLAFGNTPLTREKTPAQGQGAPGPFPAPLPGMTGR